MVPKYLKLKDEINAKILSNEYPLGSKLPTENTLSEIFNVSRSTVRQALELLCFEGIIEKRWGSGNVVVSKSDISKKNIVNFLVPYPQSDNTKILIDELSLLFLKEGYSLNCLETKGSLAKERTYLKEMLNDVYAGLILAPVHSSIPSTNNDLIHLLLKRQFPVIFLGPSPLNIYNSTNISMDDYSRGYQMARRYINEGHKHLGGIFMHDSLASVYAFNGYIDAIRDADLPIIDEAFLWVNSSDITSVDSINNTLINKFLAKAYELATIVYTDNSSIKTDGTFPIYSCSLTPAKSFSKELVRVFMTIKKNGNSMSVTIPYK